ncbi:MAG: ComEC/Rec2 family competence protein, partial [Alistipes sp.]|nr:ComEC/Rec2 family competence protein [Alistipes sp.]
HLLAVSGLHVGYLFALINLLLLPLALFRRGQVARALVAIAVIWGYAAMTGLAPSTIRAAVMFSLLQLSLLVASRYNSLNALCFTAMAMLLWRGENIYDAGFQLSVLAVFAIVEWAMPVIRWVAGWHRLELEERQRLQRHKFRMLLRVVFIWAERWLLSSFAISVAASLITIPLASYLFGQFSLWSVVVGPVMVLLAGVVVGVSLLWILMPMGLLQGVASGILELSVGWMNSLAEWCSRMGLVAYDIRIDLSLCIIIYIIYALLTALVWGVEKGAKKRKPTIG